MIRVQLRHYDFRLNEASTKRIDAKEYESTFF